MTRSDVLDLLAFLALASVPLGLVLVAWLGLTIRGRLDRVLVGQDYQEQAQRETTHAVDQLAADTAKLLGSLDQTVDAIRCDAQDREEAAR